MVHQIAHARKVKRAEEIFAHCTTRSSAWTGYGPSEHESWTRDFTFAVLPLLLERRKFPLAKRYLEELGKRQRPNGQIPVVFIDRPVSFVSEKIGKSIRKGKLSFMLKRYLSGNLWNLNPGTHDSELLYLIAIHDFAAALTEKDPFIVLQEKRVGLANKYLNLHLLKNGMIIGGDWRDDMHIELEHKPLLSNNVLLHRVWERMNQTGKAHHLKELINKQFWSGSHYRDSPTSVQFDPFGTALGILYKVIPHEHFPSVVNSFIEMDSTNGITIHYKTVAEKANNDSPENRSDRIVCPAVVSFCILALLKMGEVDFAEMQFRKLCALNGFYEFHDPVTAKGIGAPDQLRSAALFIRAANAFEQPKK